MGRSISIEVIGVHRVAVADGKVVRARVIPPSTVLLTGMSSGVSTVRVWGKGEEELALEVRVVPQEVASAPGRRNEKEVVRVALEFLELDSALSRSLGLRWPEAIQFSSSGTYAGGSGTSGLNYSATFSSAKGWIAHLVKEGWAKVLASPELYVRIGEEAIFQSGGELPVPTTSENHGRYHKHVEWKPYGMNVKVRPKSADLFRFVSDIRVEISEIDDARTVEGIPSLLKRELETKMSSEDGETVVLSGLVRQATRTERESVPILSSIPLLGPLLFSKKSTASEETDIFMGVTFSMVTRASDRGRADSFHKRFHSATPFGE